MVLEETVLGTAVGDMDSAPDAGGVGIEANAARNEPLERPEPACFERMYLASALSTAPEASSSTVSQDRCRVCNGAWHGRQRAQNRLKGVYARLRRAMAPLRAPDRLTTRFRTPYAVATR